MIGFPFAKRQLDGIRWPRSGRDLLVNAASALTIALVATVSGPFGTFCDLDLGGRLVYWLASFAAGWAITVGLITLLLPRLAAWGLPPPLAGALCGAVGALPLSAVVLALERGYRPDLADINLALLYLYVAAIAVPMGAGMVATMWHSVLTVAPSPPAPANTVAPTFLKRLPPRLGTELLALAMEDHYVRIHTAQGSDLLLMRFVDALSELGAADGLRVHRSYWVARRAVAAAERTGRRLTLTLTNGLQVPVSRTYAPSLERQRWILP